MSFDFSTLIVDRRQSDIDAVLELYHKIESKTATPAELAQFLESSMKGAYNYTDFNRVTACMNYLNDSLNKNGYATNGFVVVTDIWDDTTIVRPKDFATYVNNVKVIRNAIALPEGSPVAPELTDTITLQDANDIEYIMQLIEIILNKLNANPPYCGLYQSNAVMYPLDT